MPNATTGNGLNRMLFKTLLSGLVLSGVAIAGAVWAHETRITRNETCVAAIHEDIREIKGMLSTIITQTSITQTKRE